MADKKNIELPIQVRAMTTAEQRGAQFLLDWLDNKFNLWQDDPMHYHITIFRHDFHEFLKKHNLHFQGGW